MTLQKGMSNKERRMLKAARMRWHENMDLQTIAEQLGLKYGTVRNYFSSDEMKRFERFYSESDIQLLQAQLEQMVRDGTRTALDIQGGIQNDDEVSARVKVKALKEAQKIPERHITMLQELGIIDKPGDDNDSEGSESTEDLRQELIQGLNEKKKELENSV